MDTSFGNQYEAGAAPVIQTKFKFNMVTLEEIKQCKSYAQAIKLVLNKDYTNGSTIKKTKE